MTKPKDREIIPPRDLLFWMKVELDDSEYCWNWRGWFDRDGYGRFGNPKLNTLAFGIKSTGAHRISYTMLAGSIPEGLEIDHLCFNTACVNPRHLRTVTRTVNLQSTPKVFRTHCKNGHEMTAENTIYSTIPGHIRECRECRKRIWTESNRKKSEKLVRWVPPTHCKRGHLFEDGYVASDGVRRCRVCKAEQNALRLLRNKARA